MTPNVFRAIVLAHLLFMTLSAFVDLLFPTLVPPAIASAIATEPLPPALSSGWALWVSGAWALALLGASVGLLFFKRWARTVALWGTLGGFALFPLLGGGYASGWSTALQDAAATTWGVANALAWFGPVAQRFAPHASGGSLPPLPPPA